MISSHWRLLCVSVSLWLLACSSAISHAQQIHFRDVTAQAGIHFTHNNGAFGKKWLPETMGPGCAFIDYDNDGYPDIFWSMARTGPNTPTPGQRLQSYTTTIATEPSAM